MTDYPILRWPPLNTVTPFHPESLGMQIKTASSGAAMFLATSGVPRAANEVYYYPFAMYEAAVAVKLSYAVGATASGNCDLGIYDSQKNRLVNSGSTAQGSINTLQELDITDTLLAPGLYYMAITLSSATGTFIRTSMVDEIALSSMALYTEALGSFGLPATAAFATATDTSPLLVAMAVHFDSLV